MKKEIAEKWVEALRSGEYRQTRSELRRLTRDGNYEFCPLGVLCDISKLGGWVGESYYRIGQEETSICLLPQVMEWAGMRTSNGRYCHEPGPKYMNETIMARNDEGKYTFRRLANLIEWQWENL